jgi:nuclear transport factor 2 (NTF2) superfamily protein
MNNNNEARPPFPPFNYETVVQKLRMAEDGWNGQNPQKIAMAYTADSQWRNRNQLPNGRAQIIEFLTEYKSGLMRLRYASINDLAITEAGRKFH